MLKHAASIYSCYSLSVSTEDSSESEKGFRLSEESYISIRFTVKRCKQYSAQSLGTLHWKNVPV